MIESDFIVHVQLMHCNSQIRLGRVFTGLCWNLVLISVPDKALCMNVACIPCAFKVYGFNGNLGSSITTTLQKNFLRIRSSQNEEWKNGFLPTSKHSYQFSATLKIF